MKKKKIFIILSVLILLTCFSLFAPVTFGIKKQISISAPVMRVAVQVSDLKNWPHWNVELKDTAGAMVKLSALTNDAGAWLQTKDGRLDVTQYTPSFVVVHETHSLSGVYHEVFVKADSNVNKTIVVWIDNFSLFAWIREKMASSHQAEENLLSLKNFMEDPRQYYGFDIRRGSVIDTLEIAKMATCLKTQRNLVVSSLYKEIFDYAKTNNIDISETPRMANFTALGKDSLKIMVGIPVNKKVPAANGISLMEMPSQGKVAIGHYAGDYAGIKKLYSAMNQYIFDNHLQIVAAPYERYLTNPRTAADSLHMSIDLYYPLYY